MTTKWVSGDERLQQWLDEHPGECPDCTEQFTPSYRTDHLICDECREVRKAEGCYDDDWSYEAQYRLYGGIDC